VTAAQSVPAGGYVCTADAACAAPGAGGAVPCSARAFDKSTPAAPATAIAMPFMKSRRVIPCSSADVRKTATYPQRGRGAMLLPREGAPPRAHGSGRRQIRKAVAALNKAIRNFLGKRMHRAIRYACVSVMGICVLGPQCRAPMPAVTPPPASDAAIEALTEIMVEAPEPRYVSPTRRDQIGRIWAPVMINGHGPFRLVLDTGASHSAVTELVALALGIPTDQSPP